MNSILILIKNPVKGKAKTRLAATVGEEEALRIYKELLAHTRRITTPLVDVHRYLLYSDFIDTVDEWSEELYEKHLQRGADLGERMNNGFHMALRKFKKSVIIGGDCPQLSMDLLEQAFEQLNHHDIVIGPAIDGGYYLLGMKEKHPYLFENMNWSTAEVAQTTIDRIKSKGLSYYTLPPLSDVDREEDWKKYGW